MSEFLLWLAVLVLVAKVMRLSTRVSAMERFRYSNIPTPDVAVAEPEPQYEPVAAGSAMVPPPLPEMTEPEAVVYAAPPEPEPEPAPKRVIDWESVLGTNLLNKLGVLLLLVGIALFLGYSLTVFGPGGRVAIGVATGLTILAAGVFAEKREGYAMFGRGLIGGGWAALYFTTFASYAIPAAQVIANPVVGTVLLLCVSAAMILHSLRYRSETVTGMAYLLSFLTLGVSGAPVLAIIATLPLAVSLIYLSYRFAWPRLVLGGLPIAYAVFFLQSQVANVASPELLKLMLLTYWIVFESAEVMRPSGTWLPFVLNGICFSFLAWGSPAIAASAYAASTAMRIKFGREYRGALTALSVLCGKAIFQHTSGLVTPVALLVEAELLFLAGVRWKQSYIRYLAAAGFVVGIPTLLVAVFEKQVDFAWLAAIVMTGVLMFVNFYLHRASRLFPWVGTVVLAIAIGSEAPTPWLGVAWLALAGLLSLREEFRLQTRAMGALAVATLGVVNVAGFEQSSPLPWQPQFVAALMLFAGAVRSGYAVPAATAGAVMAATLMWNVLPAPLVALGWAALSLGLYETGFRRQGEAMALAAFGRLFIANFDLPDRLLTTTPVIALQYYLYSRGSRWFVYIGGIALATLIRFQAGHVMVVIGWAAMALACQAIGSLRDNRDFRIQAYLLAALTFVRCWTTNFYEPAVLDRVWTAVIVIACLFAAHLISRRDRETFARPLFSTLASALLSVLLFFEVSGKVLTMAWAVEGAVLLAAGFLLRERHVRFTGLGLLAACVAKLFFYDFATLDTPYRIASFLLLGFLFIAGSWVYTRFRKQIEEAM